MLRKGRGGLYKAPAKEEKERLRGERDQIKFIDPRFERGQVVRFRKAISCFSHSIGQDRNLQLL